MSLACLTALILLTLRADCGAGPATPAGFTEEPALTRLFTPRGVPPGTYRAYVSGQDLDSVLAAIRGDASVAAGTGSFEPKAVIASEAFGRSGGYNRWELALLYGAKRARVARGPREENGEVVEAWTLISPYPDSKLERLNHGTLLIVLKLTN